MFISFKNNFKIGNIFILIFIKSGLGNKLRIKRVIFFTEFKLEKVPRAGVEPARSNEHMALNHACLPVSAPGLFILS